MFQKIVKINDLQNNSILHYNKTMKIKYLVLAFLLYTPSYAQVGIGTSSPNASAILDVTSENKGFLLPSMPTNTSISNPVEGLTIYNTNLNCLEVYNGKRWINCTSISSTDVYNPATGQIWMDRNLGASQVATSSTDFNGYGSLFQWGRAADGHQLINWTNATTGTPVTTTTSNTLNDIPSNATFIIALTTPYDWRQNPNNDLWQGATGTNNPCPSGYRVPTESEWQAEINSWETATLAGAFASPLKLCATGVRDRGTGSVSATTTGYYWSSTVSGSNSRFLNLNSSVNWDNFERGYGISVRCIKN
ncbi:MAG: hypothetical protein RIR36_22 [Bacteroidota bacterium]|jgi:uncharacterized protein (TIGR02145 family)